MEVPSLALDTIRAHEGLRLTSYQDEGGTWTIGYGTTQGVTPGQTITIEQAEGYLLRDALEALKAVKNGLSYTAWQGLNVNKRAALCSFVYNVGSGNWQRSTMRDLINQGATPSRVAKEFPRWVMVNGQPSEGLRMRRKAEADLYLMNNAGGIVAALALGYMFLKG